MSKEIEKIIKYLTERSFKNDNDTSIIYLSEVITELKKLDKQIQDIGKKVKK